MGKRPKIRPGVARVCFLPSFVPPSQNVELISASGHNFFMACTWKAVFETIVRPTMLTLFTGKAPPSVDWKSNLPHPLPPARVGVTMALDDPFL